MIWQKIGYGVLSTCSFPFLSAIGRNKSLLEAHKSTEVGSTLSSPILMVEYASGPWRGFSSFE